MHLSSPKEEGKEGDRSGDYVLVFLAQTFEMLSGIVAISDLFSFSFSERKKLNHSCTFSSLFSSS
jgi:hypothetical protein